MGLVFEHLAGLHWSDVPLRFLYATIELNGGLSIIQGGVLERYFAEHGFSGDLIEIDYDEYTVAMRNTVRLMVEAALSR